MFKGEFDFNKSVLQDFKNFCALPQYGRVYCTTNEPIEAWQDLTPVKKPRVLTVAASGDQPLMYAAAGASHIDTFDITVNACAMMDFKTTALQSMSYEQYTDSLKLFACCMARKTPNTRKRILSVVKQMPNRTRDLMTQIIKNPIYSLEYMDNKQQFPSKENLYSQMRHSVHAPFNFIWSDLINVTNYIDDKYDIINLSNIFDHYLWYQKKSLTTVCRTLDELWPYLNNGGYILCTTNHKKIIELMHTLRQSSIKPVVPFSMGNAQLNWHPIIIQKTH